MNYNKIGDGVLGEQAVQIVVHMQIYHGPVIQPRPLHRPVADVEPQGASRVWSGPHGRRDSARSQENL